MVWVILVVFVVLHLLCMLIINPIYMAFIDRKYNINSPVNLLCLLGLFGLPILFTVHCMVRDDIWYSRNQNFFYRTYSTFKDEFEHEH